MPLAPPPVARIIILAAFTCTALHSQDLTVSGGPNGQAGTITAIVSDDFHAPALNQSVWSVLSPLNDAVVSVTGAGTTDARLAIALPAGVSHDLWTGAALAPRILQNAPDTDFEVEAKFDSPLISQYQFQGIIVQQDSANFLRFDFVRDNTGTRVFAASFVAGAATGRADVRIASATPMYLRVKRQGNSWTQSYSFDGTAWTSIASFSQTLRVTAAGPYAGNHGIPASSSPAFTALVDYFFNTSAPIIPEDGVQQTSGPSLSFWYGSNQVFGRTGTTQRWVNILGNVADPDGVASLAYTLNGGNSQPLSVGANRRRLDRKGDFNIDIANSALQDGANTVTVTATDNAAHSSTASITVTKVAGRSWPVTYGVAWTTPASLQDSAQVVDGKWAIVTGGIRPQETGYDRLVALGDTTWTDYEISALVTVHSIDSTQAAYDTVNGAPGLGFLMRWVGHTDAPNFGPQFSQPRSGYLPVGSIGWYTWRNGFNSGLQNRWELLGNDNLAVIDQNSTTPLPYETPYYIKMRVKTIAGQGGLYSFKAWPASQQEPASWMLNGQEHLYDPQRGSVLLVAHHVDVTIGPVTVRPVDSTPPVLSGIAASPGTTTATVTWTTDEPASGTVYYGLTATYTDSVVSPGLVTAHAITLTELTPERLYHYKIKSTDASTNSAASADLTFTTSPASSLAFQSDDFHAAALNTTLWTFVNPRSDAAVSVVGAGTTDVRLSVAVPAGVSHDVWSGTNNAARVMQAAANTDFELEVKFDAPLTAQYQIQGVIVQQDNANFMRFDFVRDNTGPRLFAASFSAGTPTVRTDTRISAGTPIFMRVKRQGNTWTQSYSFDGIAWTASPSFNQTLSVSQVGPFIGNHGIPETSTPAFTGLIDYFFNRAAPIVPEDGTTQASEPVITQEPVAQTVTAGQTATFTVTATGTAPLSYQWQKNGLSITGATAASYTTPVTASADSGALFRCIAYNSAGADTSLSALLSVRSGSSNPSGILSDQFGGSSLNSALWTFVNPLGDGVVSLTGAQLALTLPAGVSHDVWTSGNLAPRIMQPAANTDFEVELKFDVVLSLAYQMQGLIVQQDASTFLRCDMYHDGSAVHIFAASFVNNVPTVLGDITLPGASPGYLRLKRQADQWTVSYSNGTGTWTPALTFSRALVVSSVGPFAANHGIPASSSPGWTALIDHFLNVAAPNAAAWSAAPGSATRISPGIPGQFALEGNYPNPFNPATTIRYSLPEPATVSIKVFSMLGQEITTLEEGPRDAGYHELVWHGRRANGGQLSSGMFLCRMVATGASGKAYADVRRMILLK